MSDEPQGSPPPGGWLPPENPGGAAPGGGPPAGGGPPGQPPYPQQPPHPQQPPSPYSQPPQGWGQQPPQYGQQPPQYGQPNPYGQPSPWASTYYWQQSEPDNTPAIAGFIMSIASIATLVMFFGFLSPVNLCVSVAAIFVSRNGIKKVERGETTKNKDLAKWGFWLGIVGTVLAALVIIAFIAVVASSPEWFDDLDTTEPR
jgi:hypothetical protein